LLTIVSDPSKTDRVPAAMAATVSAVAPRRTGSIRRTSHIDMLLGGGSGLVLRGRARDLMTPGEGDADVVAEATIGAELDHEGSLLTLDVSGSDLGSRNGEALVGLAVSAGFRDAVRNAFADDVRASSPLALLLDDLPVAALISGYGLLYQGLIPATSAKHAMKTDICSGWRSDGTMMTSVYAGGGVPVTIGPKAPVIAEETVDDPSGWHAFDDLPVGAMRRRRMVDVLDQGETWAVTAMFRDTHVDAIGNETVLHEYTLTALVDAQTRTFTMCRAVPRVLPWVECPVAAASADRLTGQSVDGIRGFVRSSLKGTSTCTHLNDLLRSLGDVPALARALA
jgi:Protein of unknown function (DUF2889)